MKINDITKDSLAAVDNQELLNLHWRCHQLYALLTEGGAGDGKSTDGLTVATLLNKFNILRDEMIKRGLNYTQLGKATSMPTDEEYGENYFSPGLIDVTDLFIRDFAAISPYIQGQDVLVMGCGAGRELDVLSKSGFNVEGVDNSITAMKLCGQHNHKVKKEDVNKLSYPDGAFDTVLSMHTLEHLSDPNAAIDESLRIARMRAIHLVPLGKRLDLTHKREFKSMDDLRSCMAGYEVAKYIFRTEDNNAVVVFDKTAEAPAQIFNGLGDMVLCPGYINLVGGSIKQQEPHDIDMLIRQDNPDSALEVKVRNQIPEGMRHLVHYVYHASGPHDDHIPLYDLVAVLRPEAKRINVSKADTLKPLQRFIPLKTAGGYSQQEYFTPEEFNTGWAEALLKEKIGIDVEQKYNGWRTVLEADSADKTLIFFEDSKDDRSKQFPSLVDDLKAIGQGVILDADLGAVHDNGRPVARKDLAAWAGNQVVPVSGQLTLADGSKASIIAHVFDVLYYDGQDLHSKPWTERRGILEDLFGKYDFKFMKITPKHVVDNKAALLKIISDVSKQPGSEGAVAKAVNSDYPLTGQTPAWSKIKNLVEIKVQVLSRQTVSGSPRTWNYTVAYEDDKGKLVTLGKTFNTNLDAPDGSIITLGVEEIIPEYDNVADVWKITAVVPKVRDREVGSTKAENIKSIVQRADEGNVLQADPETRAALLESGFKVEKRLAIRKQTEGQLDFKAGDSGTAILQTHERGLTEDQVKLLGGTFHFGVDPIKLTPVQITKLDQIAKGNWTAAIANAADGDSSQLSSLIKGIDKTTLNKDQLKLLALVEPVSIHTDIRMRPGTAPYWEGGEGFTPGNQFQINKFIELDPTHKILANFKTARSDEGGAASGQVIQGPLSWMNVGANKPQSFPPGAVGSTTNAWSRLTIIDKIKWKAGTQDPHYKEFWFDGKLLKGRWIFQFVPVGPGRREWMIARPADQEFPNNPETAKPPATAPTQKAYNTTIIKIDTVKRLVTGIVLEPETFDAQDQIYDAPVIEKAAHDFLAEYNKGSKTGVMHEDYSRPIEVVESWIAPITMMIGDQQVKPGTWIMTVHVTDNETWKQVENNQLTGFSIKGMAVARRLGPERSVA